MSDGLPPVAMALAAVAAMLCLAVPVSALARDGTPGSREKSAAALAKAYATCMELARSAPEKGLARATAWEKEGGDEGARHCAAVSLLNLGKYDRAAERLESLAATVRKPDPGLKSDLFAQAGQAWLIAGKSERALAAQTRAIAVGGERVELLLDRAIALASLARYWEAIDDLNRALDLSPGRVEALVFRATAWRKLDNPELALDDLERALANAPGNPDALLERGIVRHLLKDDDGARRDWKKVMEIDATSPAGQAARGNLFRLEGSPPAE